MQALVSDLPICFSEVGIVRSGVAILDEISLTFSAGAPTLLIGPNGSGKTTVLRAAMGLLSASRGRITWGGRDVSPPTRRAIMFQHPVMLRRSAAANIRYALAAAGVARAKREPRVVELLTLVGLHSLAGRPARRQPNRDHRAHVQARLPGKEHNCHRHPRVERNHRET